MHANCLIAEYPSLDQANIAIEALKLNDFASDAVSIAWRGHEDALQQIEEIEEKEEVQKEKAKKPPDVKHSMEIGGLIAGAVAVPVSMGTLMFPVMVAGPLLAAGGGAAAGALFSEHMQWGVDEQTAKHYDQRIADGSVLVIVTSTPLRLDQAKACLLTTSPVSLKRFARS